MIKGGYKIVNFNGAALSGTAVTLSGIYDQIVDDYDKPVMVSGVSLNGDIMDDAYAGVKEKTVESTKVVELTVYGGIITVTEDDEVTFAVSKSLEELAAEIEELETTEELYSGSAVRVYRNNKTIICTFASCKIEDIITALTNIPKPSGTFRNVVWNEDDKKAAVVSITSSSVDFLDTNPWGPLSVTTKVLHGEITWMIA